MGGEIEGGPGTSVPAPFCILFGRLKKYVAAEIRGPSKSSFIPFIEYFAVAKILKAVVPQNRHSFKVFPAIPDLPALLLF